MLLILLLLVPFIGPCPCIGEVGVEKFVLDVAGIYLQSTKPKLIMLPKPMVESNSSGVEFLSGIAFAQTSSMIGLYKSHGIILHHVK